MLDVRSPAQALHDLEEFARDVAAGRSPRCPDITPTLGQLKLDDGSGDWILRVLSATCGRMANSAAARRRFFHAARALVSLRREE